MTGEHEESLCPRAVTASTDQVCTSGQAQWGTTGAKGPPTALLKALDLIGVCARLKCSETEVMPGGPLGVETTPEKLPGKWAGWTQLQQIANQQTKCWTEWPMNQIINTESAPFLSRLS